jgi:hypothetical protein
MSSDTPTSGDTIVDKIPKPGDFGERLLDAVTYLSNQDNSALSYSGEVSPVERQREELKQKNFDGDWKFELDPPWEVTLGEVSDARNETQVGRPDFENARGYAQIAGEVKVSNGRFKQYSFSLCLLSQAETEGESTSDTEDETFPCCWTDSDYRWRVARRLHFDIDMGENDDEEKPVAHVQLGGEMPNMEINFTGESFHYCDSSLDKPRIPYPPTDPVILLDMLVRQYPGISSADSKTWRNKVRRSEKLLREDYHGYVGGLYGRDSREPLGSHLSNGLGEN